MGGGGGRFWRKTKKVEPLLGSSFAKRKNSYCGNGEFANGYGQTFLNSPTPGRISLDPLGGFPFLNFLNLLKVNFL